jgi:hypothetical protein
LEVAGVEVAGVAGLDVRNMEDQMLGCCGWDEGWDDPVNQLLLNHDDDLGASTTAGTTVDSSFVLSVIIHEHAFLKKKYMFFKN